jgi:hypothetical protein
MKSETLLTRGSSSVSIKKLMSLFLLVGALASCGDEMPAIELHGAIEDSPLGYPLNRKYKLDKLLLKITASAPLTLDRVTVEIAEVRPSGTPVCAAASIGHKGDAVHLKKGESIVVPIYNCSEEEVTKITLVTWDEKIEYAFNPRSVEIFLSIALLATEPNDEGVTKVSFNIVPEPISWLGKTDDIEIKKIEIKGGKCALNSESEKRIESGYTIYEGETEFIELIKCHPKMLEEVTITTAKRKYSWFKTKN